MPTAPQTSAYLKAVNTLYNAGYEAVGRLVSDYLSTANLTIDAPAAWTIGVDPGFCSRLSASLALASGQSVTAHFHDARGSVTYRLFWSFDGYDYLPALYDVTQSVLIAGRGFQRAEWFDARPSGGRL